VSIEGAGPGMNLGARVVEGDLYVLLLTHPGDDDEHRKTLFRLVRGGVKLERLVDALAFDVSGEDIYYVDADGVHVRPR
jgi:hypothetical protein